MFLRMEKLEAEVKSAIEKFEEVSSFCFVLYVDNIQVAFLQN